MFDDYARATGPAVAFTFPVTDVVVRTDRLRVPPFFAGLLPEGDSRRGDIQRAFHLAEDDELGLLSVIGADTVGDTQVVPAGKALPEDPEPTVAWDEVSFAELWRKVPGPRTQSALPGVQPKTSAHSRSLHGGAVGPLIGKFPIAGWHGVLQNERLFMSAAEVGLLGATQLLGIRRGQKYDPDARSVIDALASRCAARKVAVRDLFHQLVYSYMIGNNDLHAKNLSIRQDPASGLWSVSPTYDVLHTWRYEGDHRFSPAVRPDGPRDAVSRKWWLELAADLGLPAKAAQRIIQHVTRAAESMISRALARDGLPTALHRDVRRVIAKRARDLSGDTG